MNKSEKPSIKVKPHTGLKNANYKKYSIKLPLGIHKPYPSSEWFLVELLEPLMLCDTLYTHQITDNHGFIVKMVNIDELDKHIDIVRIHNENLLLGISDEAYNETLNEIQHTIVD